MTRDDGLLLMAEVMGAQGLRGAVKLRVFGDDPEGLPGYPPLHDPAKGRTFRLKRVWEHSGIWLAEIEGVTDRTAAENLRGLKLYLPRADLPEIAEDGTYYHADLTGLAAVKPDGTRIGTIESVANFGAGDLLEIRPLQGATFYVPFTDAVVPRVDIKGGTVTVDPPPGLLA
jgi:16S rRNA processing protein RimM